ncbi:hypothetical protein G9A89_011449 [Geosiphon pyriformis]|nr:hypothetical protein G9A89_011449 [Geosiphon pyriformis]
MELEKRIQGPKKIVTKYAKAIRKLIKCVDSRKNWTEEQKIYSFTKGLRTDLLYAHWSFLTLKNNPTMDMAIELTQKIEDNQRMHLESILSVFAPAPAMQSKTTSNSKNPDLNPALISPNNYYIKDNKIVAHLNCNNSLLPPPASRNNDTQNNKPNNNNSKSASQPEKNSFYAFNLTDDNHDIDELAINTSESTRKKKKAKVDFVLDPKKASTLIADNNKSPKAKVFKNLPKLEFSEIVQKSGLYSVFRKNFHKSLIPKKKTPKTNKCLCQTGFADNSNVTSLICKTQVAGYFIDLILDSGSSVSVIAKHFLEAIGRKIDEPSTRPITNIYGNKKKDLGIVKAIPVHINDISIEINMKVSEAKEYTIIVGNEWLKKAKALLNYELCKLTIRYGKKPIVIKCHYWTTSSVPKQNQEEKQSNESDNDESDDEDQEEQKKTVEFVYIIFTSNGKPLDNIKADKEEIIVNDKLICCKKAKYSYWWHGSYAWYWCNKPLYSPSNKCKSCLIYYKNWEPISLIFREELKKVQKSFESKLPEIQSLVAEQKESSSEERKVNIENLLARNSPVISKEDNTPG